MRTLISTKFLFKKSLKPIIIFYAILFTVLGLLFIPEVEQDSNSNIEMTASIFLFAIGLNFYKEEFKFGLVNGCSRKTIFSAGILSLLSLAGLMAVVDTLTTKVMMALFDYKPMIERIYNRNYGTITGMLEGFLWAFAIYSLVAVTGYFITILYYRMNKLMKVVVSVGIPLLFMMVLPYLDSYLDGVIYRTIWNFILRVFGLYNTVNPYIAIASFFGGVIIFSGLSFLLARRAPIKD